MPKKGDISPAMKHEITAFLLQNWCNGKVKRGAMKDVMSKYGISESSVTRIWHAAKDMIKEGEAISFHNNCLGKTHRDKFVMDAEKIINLRMKQRGSIRKMVARLNISKSLLGRWISLGLSRAHTSAIKPALTEINKLARLKFSLSQLHVQSVTNNSINFQNMYDTVHIDEKWFYLTKTMDRCYLLPYELEPYRTCKSKKFIPKVMFMCAVGRPQKRQNGESDFDGKFRIFPFITEENALRGSKNRPKGTKETKAMQFITKTEIKACLINQIIPAIKAKWPNWASKEIIIQQDNAKPHIKDSDIDFQNAANSDGIKIKLICQPANSPDTNINDLGFFKAIQLLQDEKPAKNVEDLLRNVFSSYEELAASTINNVFLTLQGCYAEMLKVHEGNHYKIPHMNKARLSRLYILQETISVDLSIPEECLAYLEHSDHQDGSNYNIQDLKSSLGHA